MKFRGLKCIHYGGSQRRSESRHPPRKEAWVPLNSLLRPTHLFIHITPQNLHLYIYSHAFFLFFYPIFLFLPGVGWRVYAFTKKRINGHD